MMEMPLFLIHRALPLPPLRPMAGTARGGPVDILGGFVVLAVGFCRIVDFPPQQKNSEFGFGSGTECGRSSWTTLQPPCPQGRRNFAMGKWISSGGRETPTTVKACGLSDPNHFPLSYLRMMLWEIISTPPDELGV